MITAEYTVSASIGYTCNQKSCPALGFRAGSKEAIELPWTFDGGDRRKEERTSISDKIGQCLRVDLTMHWVDRGWHAE